MESNNDQSSPNELDKSGWVEYRFLPTPGFLNDGSYGNDSIPLVSSWIFSPSGRTGVTIDGNENRLDVLLLDVYNKLWFGHSLLVPDFDYRNVYTYHMLNETTMVVLEVQQHYVIRQHTIEVKLETRKVKYEKTKVHIFIPRADTPNMDERPPTSPHVPVFVRGKYYTATFRRVISDPPRFIAYLVPLDPSSDFPPMEFSFQLQPPPALLSAWLEITGSSDVACNHFSIYATDSQLYFTSRCYDPVMGRCFAGLFIAVDVSMLIDIYGLPFNLLEHQNILLEQVNYLTVVDTPLLREIASKQFYLFKRRGGFMVFECDDSSDQLQDQTIYLIKSGRSAKIKIYDNSWLNWYPRSCLLQFKMSLADKRLYVRVAAFWNLSLSTIANNNLVFHPNRPIDSIEGLHRMVFHDLHPIPLDNEAKKALGPYEEYKKMIENVYSSKEDENRKKHPFLQAKMLHMLLVAFGLPFMVVVFIKLILILY